LVSNNYKTLFHYNSKTNTLKEVLNLKGRIPNLVLDEYVRDIIVYGSEPKYLYRTSAGNLYSIKLPLTLKKVKTGLKDIGSKREGSMDAGINSIVIANSNTLIWYPHGVKDVFNDEKIITLPQKSIVDVCLLDDTRALLLTSCCKLCIVCFNGDISYTYQLPDDFRANSISINKSKNTLIVSTISYSQESWESNMGRLYWFHISHLADWRIALLATHSEVLTPGLRSPVLIEPSYSSIPFLIASQYSSSKRLAKCFVLTSSNRIEEIENLVTLENGYGLGPPQLTNNGIAAISADGYFMRFRYI